MDSTTGGFELPMLKSFQCPITQDVMDEPILLSDGQVYENSALRTWFDQGHTTSPLTGAELKCRRGRKDRVLQHAIEEYKSVKRSHEQALQVLRTHLQALQDLHSREIRTFNMRRSFESIASDMRSLREHGLNETPLPICSQDTSGGFRFYVDISIGRANSNRPRSLAAFHCPITQKLMQEPVVTADGVAYDRAAIEKWLKRGNTISPYTGKELKNSDLRWHPALRRSIEEYESILDVLEMFFANIFAIATDLDQLVDATDTTELWCSMLGKLIYLCKEGECRVTVPEVMAINEKNLNVEMTAADVCSVQ